MSEVKVTNRTDADWYIDKLEARVAALEAGLREYGRHDWLHGCAAARGGPACVQADDARCTCGLRQLLEGTK